MREFRKSTTLLNINAQCVLTILFAKLFRKPSNQQQGVRLQRLIGVEAFGGILFRVFCMGDSGGQIIFGFAAKSALIGGTGQIGGLFIIQCIAGSRKRVGDKRKDTLVILFGSAGLKQEELLR